jgi:hypothetical protein
MPRRARLFRNAYASKTMTTMRKLPLSTIGRRRSIAIIPDFSSVFREGPRPLCLRSIEPGSL